MDTTTRNADLTSLAALLQEQHGRKLDVVAPATSIRAKNGKLRIDNTDVEPDADGGLREVAGYFDPTDIANEGLSDKLGVPVQYLKRIYRSRPDLWESNINGWLHGRSKRAADGTTTQTYESDTRSFLVRCFKGDDGSGIARAFLSENYKIIDNLDVLTAALEGVKEAQTSVEIEGCDLTERRMYVRVVAPEIQKLAPALLEGYRSPFDQGVVRAGATSNGEQTVRLPIIFAGFILSNSETGSGAFTITPRLVVQICRNGLTMNKDATRAIHLGGKMDDGIIKWSEDTQKKNLDLIQAKARDAVATFLDTDYMEQAIQQLEEKAGVHISEADKTVRAIGNQLRFSEERTQGILDHFIMGGQMTAGGVLNAMTSFAQTVENADEAFDIENQAMRALDMAAAV